MTTGRTRCLPLAASGLGLLLAACDSSTSPNARDLATPIMFESARDAGSGLYLASVDGRKVVPFDVGNTGARTGDWSPDGGQIAFTRIAPRVQVWLANADGSNPVQLTHSTGASDEPRWMPNGTSVSYENNDDPTNWGINAVKLDGSDPHRVPNTALAILGYSWGPNGRVVFARYDAVPIPGTGEYQSIPSLYVADTTQTAPVRLTTNTDCGDAYPEWSPDGSKIAFASCAGSRSSIVVIAADGSGRVNLTPGDGVDSRPTWSPDGSQIAFQRGMGSSADVWLMSVDGSNQVNITRGNPRFDGVPKWSRKRAVPG